MSQRLDQYFRDYAFFHQTKGNLLTHFIGIPLIVISLLGLLDRVQIGPVIYHNTALTFGMLLFTFANGFYFRLNTKIGIAMLLFTSISYVFGMRFSILLNSILFVVGWIFQLLGHKVFEKKNPAFLKNFTHVLIGPAFIINEIFPLHRKDSIH